VLLKKAGRVITIEVHAKDVVALRSSANSFLRFFQGGYTSILEMGRFDDCRVDFDGSFE